MTYAQQQVVKELLFQGYAQTGVSCNEIVMSDGCKSVRVDYMGIKWSIY